MTNYRLQKTVCVSESHKDWRIDKYLCEISQTALGEPLSRSRVLDLIKSGAILLEGKSIKPSYKVQVGDQILISFPKLTPSELQPYETHLEILFEDDSCVVVNKPSGLVVHPAAGHEQDTLVNALLSKVQGLTVGIKEQRPGIVHRLDKDTSGILVVAKTDSALNALAKQFKEKSVDRHYYALVSGEWPHTKITITSYLQRHPTQRKKFCSGKESTGKIAITHVERLRAERGISLLRCRLETGRTHQIRVHLSEKGFPILNDPIYGGSRSLRHLGQALKEKISGMSGIGLHAYELGFTHPVTQERLLFQVPWPENLKPLIKELGFHDI